MLKVMRSITNTGVQVGTERWAVTLYLGRHVAEGDHGWRRVTWWPPRIRYSKSPVLEAKGQGERARLMRGR